MITSDTVERVSVTEQNDRLRRTGVGGSVVITPGVQALSEKSLAAIMAAVAAFDDFTPANDPYGEHDFGHLEFEDQSLFFKIDAYDLDLTYGSPDPTDPAVTRRVMTVMLAEEY